METELIVTKILRCGVPIGPLKRIYPRSEVIRAMDKYLAEKNRFGKIGFDDVINPSIRDYTHHVENLSLDADGFLVATIKFLMTPIGQEAKKLYENGILHFRTASYGDVEDGDIIENGAVNNLQFWMICLVDDPTTIE
jgi:hypothetical protein